MDLRRWLAITLILLISIFILYLLRPTPTSDFWYWSTYILIPSLVAALIVILRRHIFYTVRTGEVGIVERGGKFCGIASPGLVVTLPFLENIRTFPTTEQHCECDEKDVLTRDGVAIGINMLVRYQLQEPVEEAVYRIAYRLPDWEMAVAKQAIAALHQQIGTMTSDEVMQGWTYLGERIRDILQPTMQNWGIDIVAVQLFNMRIPEHLRRALEDSRQAEIEARTVEYRAGGEAERLRQIAESLKNCDWLDGVLTERYIEALEKMSVNPASHILLPIEILHTLKALGAGSTSLLGQIDGSKSEESSSKTEPESPKPEGL
nr:SPFH domain-containing protein [Chloroflexota bacterium]